MSAQPDRLARWRPRSLRARQLWAASLGLVAFVILTGYVLDRAFMDVASQGLRERMQAYAYAYAGGVDFARDGTLIPPDVPPDSRFEQPGSGLYAMVRLDNGRWQSASAQGPQLPDGPMLAGLEEEFSGPLPMVRTDGAAGEVYRFGLGLVWAGEDDPQAEFPYTIYVMEDAKIGRAHV